MQIYVSLNRGLPTAYIQQKGQNIERKYCLISECAVSLAEITAESTVMRAVLLESCVSSLRADQRPSLLYNKGLASWHNALSSSTVAFNLN